MSAPKLPTMYSAAGIANALLSGEFTQEDWWVHESDYDALRARVAELRLYEHIEGRHEESGLMWSGPRYRLPPEFFEVSNESGEPGERAAPSAGAVKP